MSELSVQRAQVRYGRSLAIDDVSVTVQSGSALGVVGESGSGKTTLARAIVGQLPLSSGRVLLDGAPVARGRSERRAIQLVPQNPYATLNPRMTVAQTVAELLRVHRIVPRAQRRERIAELLETVRLDPESMDAYPHEFSGGQRQRIALARALAVEPRVLVADEPTSALDVSVQATVVELLNQLRRELGLTLVFISHDLGVVYELCNEVLVMKDGGVVEHGAANFFEAPAAEYSRQLLAAVPRLPGNTAGR